MATTKVSALAALTTTDGAEELLINDGGTSKKVTIANLLVDDQVTAAKLANSINAEIAANTAKTSNATHSGEVTGATALTIADNIVDEANLKVSNSPTNGQFLSAQSGNTGGLTWAAASGGGGGAMEFISNSSITSAVGTVEISLPTGYNKFKIIFYGYSAGKAHLEIYLSQDNGASYFSSYYAGYGYDAAYGESNSWYTINAANYRHHYTSGEINIFHTTATSGTMVQGDIAGISTDGGNYSMPFSGVSTSQSARIDKIKLNAYGAYTWGDGDFTLYGIKES